MAAISDKIFGGEKKCECRESFAVSFSSGSSNAKIDYISMSHIDVEKRLAVEKVQPRFAAK